MTRYTDRRWLANGSGKLLRRGQTSRTQAAPPVDPGDQLVPDGYVLKKKWDLTQNEGWSLATGHTISAAYYKPANITFGATGMRIKCQYGQGIAPDGGNYVSGEARWATGSGFVPDEFYMRYTGRLEQAVILGDFPAWPWLRAQTGDGNGEIDTWETMANHIAAIPGATQSSALGNKVTMIKTPYGSSQINYSAGFTESKVGATELNFASSNKTVEIYKTKTDMTTYVNGVQMTHHVRGQGGMTAAQWDSQFAAGKLWDIRVSYQYGDWTEPSGKQHTGNAGTPQAFGADRYLNLSELLVAVPA